MKKTIMIGITALTAIAFTGITPENASAVPSFARQTGKPCSGCHTIWPRLNATGREFKITGYTDVADDYPRIQQDNLDLTRFGPPLSVSVISFPYSKKTGTNVVDTDDTTAIPDEVAIFLAGRVSPNLGAFVEPHWTRDTDQMNVELAKFSSATRVGSNILGLVVFKGDAAAADPYNTIRFSAFHTINTPAIFFDTGARGGGGDLFSFANTGNQGIVANGKFLNLVYAAVGAFRSDDSAKSPGSDPWDVSGRLAVEYPITGESIASIGGFYYDGKQRYDHTTLVPAPGPAYESKFNRYGVDLQYQLESAPHIVDFVATYMGGKDENVWDGAGSQFDVKFQGAYAEASYFYDRTYGLTVGYDYLKSDEDNSLDKKGPTVNLTYLPWLNTKIGLEYSHFELANDAWEDDTNVLLHFYF